MYTCVNIRLSKHPEYTLSLFTIKAKCAPFSFNPQPQFLSLPSLFDERYQTIIQHRITKGNQDCFVHQCGCLFPLSRLPSSLHTLNPPPKCTHSITSTSSKLMHMGNTCGSHLHSGTVSRKSAHVSSV